MRSASALDASSVVQLQQQRPVADDAQSPVEVEPAYRVDQHVEALLGDEPADREQLDSAVVTAWLRGERAEVDAVRHEDRVGADRAELPGDVGVAGDDARRSAGPIGELARLDFAGVLGMHAEAERHAELCSGYSRNLGRLMCEVAVHSVDAQAAEDPHDFGGLLFGGALAEMVNVLIE